ncbi:hypothetical protein L7F22_027643 [Adiantum nelumboides]|nr:hypothetical protein [Adiantum nelumboides]
MITAMQAPYPGAALLSCYAHARTFSPSTCVGRSTVTLAFSSSTSPSSAADDFKEAAPTLLKDRFSFVDETGFGSTTDSKDQSAMILSIEKDIDKLEHVLVRSEESEDISWIPSCERAKELIKGKITLDAMKHAEETNKDCITFKIDIDKAYDRNDVTDLTVNAYNTGSIQATFYFDATTHSTIRDTARELFSLRMDQPDEMDDTSSFVAPQKMQATFKRRNRESILSPGTLRAGKTIRVKDDVWIERIQVMIKSELSFMIDDIRKEMYANADNYKNSMYADMRKELDKAMLGKYDEMYTSLKGEMQNLVLVEVNAMECAKQKKLDEAMASFDAWKTNVETCIKEKDAEIYGSEPYADAMWDTEFKLVSLQEETRRLQTSLDSKEKILKGVLREATVLRTHLQDAEAQASSLQLFKKSHDTKQAEESSRLERLSSESLEILDNHLTVNEVMSESMEKVEKVWESIVRIYNFSASSKLIDVLQREASLYFRALLMLTEELTKAEAEVSSLHQELKNTGGMLEKERKSLRTARDGLDELDRALGNEESKVDDLFKEVSSLKAQLEQKEATIQKLKNEALKNKGLQEIARKHLNAFHESEQKVHKLAAQCNALDNQIKSKDMLLEDIKKEAFDKTEALRLAAQIKQELNLCRHREVQLSQELEREKLHAKDLSCELMENSRAVKAELALRQFEKDIVDLNKENALLRRGIESRDNVIRLMQQKLDGNIRILQSASNDREAMRKMKAHIQSLESKLKEFL